MATTATLQLPYPVSTDTANVPRDVKALADALDAASIAPAGAIQMWPGNTAPTGWFLCTGQNVPAASNPKLAALFGSSGGNVPLPDLRGRFLVGASSTRPLRTPGGVATVALTAAQMPAHDHDIQSAGNLVQLTTGAGLDGHMRAGSGSSVGRTQGAGGGGAHENMPPYYPINYIVRSG